MSQFKNKIIHSCNVEINEKNKKVLVDLPTNWPKLKKSVINENGKYRLLVTGKKSNVIVLDFDKEKGMKYYNQYKNIFDETYTETSYSGYKHVYYEYDEIFNKKHLNINNTNIDLLTNSAGVLMSEDNNNKQIIKMPDTIKNFLLDILNCKKYRNNDLDSNNSTIDSDNEDKYNENNEIDEKYYNLFKLLDSKYYNEYQHWIKPGYALYYSELDKSIAFNTWIKLLIEYSNCYNYSEALKLWNTTIKDEKENKFKIASIRKILLADNKEEYILWKNKYESKKKLSFDELQQQKIIELIKLEISTLDKNIIREKNDIEFNDLIMNEHKEYSISEISLLIRQTIIRLENNGETLYYCKEITRNKYNNNYVSKINFKPIAFKELYKYQFLISYENEIIIIDFVDILIKIKQYIIYRNLINEPYGVLSNDISNKYNSFNIFNGFLHTYDKNFNVDINIVNVWLNHIKEVICNNDEIVYKHIIYYFRHLLIKPDVKSKIVLIIKGSQGSGKNSTFDIFLNFVLGRDLSLTTPKMDLITGRFNSIRQGLLLCVLDEAVDNKNKKAMNEFKNLITSETTQIENKGEKPITLNDYCNYIILSNNDFASFIEETDRRAICLETNDKYIKDRNYFNNYYDILNNIDAGKHIFHYLINLENDEYYRPNNNMPNTEYKKELKNLQSNSVIKFLVDIYDYLDIEEDYSIYEYSVDDFFNNYIEYCEKSKLKNMSSTSFGHIVNKYIVQDRKTIQGKRYRIKKYSHEILKESLKEYI